MLWISKIENGWFPRVSPDGRYLALGTKEVYLAKLPGQPELIGPAFTEGRYLWGSGGTNQRWYARGWLDAQQLLFSRGTFNGEQEVACELWTLNPDTGEYTQFESGDVPLVGACIVARGGHWAVGQPPSGDASFRVWFDGQEIQDPQGWSLDLDGLNLVVATHAGPRLYRDGVLVDCHPIPDEGGATIRAGVFTRRLPNGRHVTWTLAASAPVDVTATPLTSCGSSELVFCNGWFWQQLEHVAPGDRTMVQGYPIGERSVYASDRLARDGYTPAHSQGWLDVVYLPDSRQFLVASLHDAGLTVVEWVSADVARVEWPVPPIPDELRDPVVAIDASTTAGESPLDVTLTCTSGPESGTIVAYRLYLDGARLPGNDACARVFLQAGVHVAFFRVQAANGKVTQTPTVTINVTARVEKTFWPPRVRGVVAGFGAPMGADRINALVERGVNLIRQDVQASLPAHVTAIVAEMDRPDLWPLYVVADTTRMRQLPERALIEWRNEPEAQDPIHYAGEVRVALNAAEPRNQVLVIGVISNPSPASLAWLKAVVDDLRRTGDWPRVGAVSWHLYPTGPGQTPALNQKALDALLAIIGDKPHLCSEFGIHTARVRAEWWRIWRRWFQLGEAEQLQRSRITRDFVLAQRNVLGAIFYQEQDGPGPGRLDHYGMTRIDGTWKPVGDLWRLT